MWKIQGVGCCGAALSGTSAVGSQDLSGEGERQNCGLGAEGLTGAGGKSCAVSLLHVSDGHLSWKLLLPSCPSCLSPKPRDCTGSSRRCTSKDRRASLGFCTGMAKWWDHRTNFTLSFGLLSIRKCVLTCNTPVTVRVA